MLSRILCDQNTEADTVEAIFKAVVDGPEALMEVYAWHEGVVSSLTLESPPTLTTAMEWVQAQKTNPAISQVIIWINAKEVSTMKVSEEMSQEVKPYLQQKGQLCLKEGVLYWCGGQTFRDCNELQLGIPLTTDWTLCIEAMMM